MHHVEGVPCRAVCAGSRLIGEAVALLLSPMAETHIVTDMNDVGALLSEPLCAVVADGASDFGQQILSMAVYATDSPLLVALTANEVLLKAVPEARVVDPTDPLLATRLREIFDTHRASR